MNHAAKRPANLVQTVECTDNLLDRRGKAPQGLGPDKPAEQVGLPKRTIQRLVASQTYLTTLNKNEVEKIVGGVRGHR